MNVALSGCRSVPELFRQRVRMSPDRPAVSFPGKAKGSWQQWTWGEYGQRVHRVAGGLSELGFRKGDRLVLYGLTEVPWLTTDMAALGLGGVSVPFSEDASLPRLRNVLERTRAPFLYVRNNKALEAVRSMGNLPESLRGIITGQGEKTDFPLHYTLNNLLERGQGREGILTEALQRIAPDDLAFIYHTSGSSKDPKPVPLRHRHALGEIGSILEEMGHCFSDQDVFLSTLPYYHIYPRVEGLAHLAFGFHGFYSDAIYERRGPLLETVSPTVLFTVPSGLKRARTRFEAVINEKKGAARKIGMAGLHFLEKPGPLVKGPVSWLLYHAYNRLVYRKLRTRMGGRLHTVISGGGKLVPNHAWLFSNLGIERVINGWGLTETTAAIALTKGGPEQIGTVGHTLPGVEIRLRPLEGREDEAVEIRGPMVFEGYGYTTERDTAFSQPFTPDGWFITGDTGRMTPTGLELIGRQDRARKLSSAKWVYPERVEDALLADPLLEYAVVFFENRPYVTALVVPERGTLGTRLKRAGIDPAIMNITGWNEDPGVRAVVQKVIDQANQSGEMEPHEQVQQFWISPTPFTIGEELTETRKVRAPIVTAQYAAIMAKLYERKD